MTDRPKFKSIDDFLALLQGVKAAKNDKNGNPCWKAFCPAHGDNDPSLSVRLTEGGTKIGITCFGGCQDTAVLQSLGLKVSQLWLHDPSKPTRARPGKGDAPRERVCDYIYTDEKGTRLFRKVRWHPKHFTQERADGNAGWVSGPGCMKDVRRVLWDLPRVIAASDILWVEGERDAINVAEKLGLVATTVPDGAGTLHDANWPNDYTDTVKGKDVVIVPDRDRAGIGHGLLIARKIAEAAASVRVLLLDVPHKGDITDWFAEHDADEWPELLATARDYTPELVTELTAMYEEPDAPEAQDTITDDDHEPGDTPLWRRIRDEDKPECDTSDPRRLCFKWPLHAPTEVYVTNYGNHAGQATIEVWMHNGDTGEDIMAIAPTVVQLTSQRDKEGLYRALKRWDSTLPWPWCVEHIAYQVAAVASQQHPAQMVESDITLSMEPEYLLEPLLYVGHPTVVFGAKAAAKSLTALTISYIVQLPLPANGLGMRPGSKTCCNVYYADWEDSEQTFQARWTAVQRGFKQRHPTEIESDLELPIMRKTMTTRLADCVDTLRADITEHRIGLLIIDSLGPAAGGDLYAPQTALDFYEAVRSLGVTTLILAHHSKDPNTKTKSIFGSQFFTTLARSVWLAERDTGEVDDPSEISVSLTEQQCNLTATHGATGLRYQFNNEARTIIVSQCDLSQTGLRKNLPVSTQIKAVLGRGKGGRMTTAALAEELEIAEGTIGRTLRRLQEKGVAHKVGEVEGKAVWCLTERTEGEL